MKIHFRACGPPPASTHLRRSHYWSIAASIIVVKVKPSLHEITALCGMPTIQYEVTEKNKLAPFYGSRCITLRVASHIQRASHGHTGSGAQSGDRGGQ